MPRNKQQAPAASEPVSEEVSQPASEVPLIPPPSPVEVLYCGVCTWPPEYCEFGAHLTKCKAWLLENHPKLHSKYYSQDALVAKLGTLSVEAQDKLEKDTAKKEAKAEAKADAEAKKKQASKVTIKRIERTKRKHVTSVHGLEAFGVDLKKAAKLLAQRFATGASVSKNAQGQDEIIIQGDVSDDLLEIIEEANEADNSSGLNSVFRDVPLANVKLVEDKKKKKDEED